jgi:hypothetical protein
MAIDLTLSSETGAPLTSAQLDSNFLTLQTTVNATTAAVNTLQTDVATAQSNIIALQAAVNAIVPINPQSGEFYSQLVLRLQKGSALTNQELDSNFVYLDTRVNRLLTDINAVNNTTVPNLQADYNAKFLLKQNVSAKLSSIAAVATNGLLAVNGDAVNPRVITGSSLVNVTNGDGIAGNPTITLSADVVTTTGSHILSNKTIDGNSNTFVNISLATAVKDTLPFANGGTNATTADHARQNLNAMPKPTGIGIVVKTDVDSAVARNVTTSGVGLSVTNGNGTGGDIVIASSATSTNTANTPIARDANGDFAAHRMFGDVVGNVTGNADTVTNGVYTNQQYNDPPWLIGLAGSKVTNIPNSSLANPSITINGTVVQLGGSFSFDAGTSSNTSNAVVKRDAAGNFAAGTITADLNGNATTASTANVANQANKLVTPRKINGVNFDGTADITIADSTKLSLSGGTLNGFITLHAEPTQAMHPVPKQYVDRNDIDPTYGTVILSSNPTIGQSFVDIFPPAGKTMSNVRAFLPAMGSSSVAQPVYSTNLIIVIDISYSMYRRIYWNGEWHDTAYKAAGRAAQSLINHYANLGPVNVCVVRTYNSYARDYKWFASYLDAYNALNTVIDWTGTSGSVIDAHDARPTTVVAQTIVHFITDANRAFGFYDAFGGSVAYWRNYLNQYRIRSHSICIDPDGYPSYINDFAWDGQLRADISSFRAMVDADLPKTYFPGVYNNASIAYQVMSDRVRISLTDGVSVDSASVNWIALWGG